MANKSIVVVTGGSGYIASWVCKRLLEEGFHVRATSRSKGPGKTDVLEKMGVEVFDGCDLLVDGSFDNVMAGASYVHHCASPFLFSPPKGADGSYFITPAVNGTRFISHFLMIS
jgi:nucleoside-diphosphate-sugar epimerase